MPERLRVWLWNLTVNLAWVILRRLGAPEIGKHHAEWKRAARDHARDVNGAFARIAAREEERDAGRQAQYDFAHDLLALQDENAALRAQLESWRDWYDDYREVLGVRAPEEASDA